ncbi:hypothetical protein DMC63_30010 [Streptomyces sp. WAC 05977]|nr:hypothetical protein DMC63_30010 [Streptomyces sp. WAC 05977]
MIPFGHIRLDTLHQQRERHHQQRDHQHHPHDPSNTRIGGRVIAPISRRAAVASERAHGTTGKTGPSPGKQVRDRCRAVRPKQVGYVPGLPEQATLATGQITPKGHDAALDENVHTVDFSSYDRQGSGYTLSVGDDVSNAPTNSPLPELSGHIGGKERGQPRPYPVAITIPMTRPMVPSASTTG